MFFIVCKGKYDNFAKNTYGCRESIAQPNEKERKYAKYSDELKCGKFVTVLVTLL